MWRLMQVNRSKKWREGRRGETEQGDNEGNTINADSRLNLLHANWVSPLLIIILALSIE